MLDKILKIISKTAMIEPDKLKPEMTLAEDLRIDSLTSVEMALDLETQFNISIEDEQLKQFKTIQDIIDFVNKNLGESNEN